jgi:hypothetical protein
MAPEILNRQSSPQDKISEIESEVSKLILAKRFFIESEISKCNHPAEHVCELSYLESTGKPWLICCLCGLTEQGWHCGYKFLRHANDHKRARIGFSDWLKTRTKAVFQTGEIVFR